MKKVYVYSPSNVKRRKKKDQKKASIVEKDISSGIIRCTICNEIFRLPEDNGHINRNKCLEFRRKHEQSCSDIKK